MTINLNHGESLFLHELPSGATQIEIRLGRKSFIADHKKYSKYESMVAGPIFVRNDAMLDRHFFEDIKAIDEAQRIQRKYNMILDRHY